MKSENNRTIPQHPQEETASETLSAEVFSKMLDKAGVRLNPIFPKPHDIMVNDPSFYPQLLRGGSLALGEGYMQGKWECGAIDEFVCKMLESGAEKWANFSPGALMAKLTALISNPHNKSRAFEVGEKHYDLGKDLYRAMLGESMFYTCAYFKHKQETLNSAQENKIRLVEDKLLLDEPGTPSPKTVLDIGCGFGTALKHMTTKHKIRGTGLTVSKEQALFARENSPGLDLDFRVEDYRRATGQYDRIFSLGMFEHVGWQNHKEYMQAAQKLLKPNGIFLLHTILAKKGSGIETEPWTKKYIFPVGVIPTEKQIVSSINGIFEIRDWHEFGSKHYDQTLMEWNHNFQKRWPALEEKYANQTGGNFKKMWEFYLLSCAGAFRAGHLDLVQTVLTHPGQRTKYPSGKYR